jgi:aryl-alcohol dehydrogenase-like predicted oxidoreductase
MEADTFTHRYVPRLGKRLFRLGLSASYGLDEAAARQALDGPFQYVFWNPTARVLTAPLRDALRRDRERYAVATGPSLGYLRGSVRRSVERALRLLNTDYLDVLQVYWVSVMSRLTPGLVEEMVRLRESGKVRSIGVSIHDRPRAGRLAADSPLDLLMIRYNAAHPGAEQDVFPHLTARRPAVVCYTATSWAKLLRRPRGWEGQAMSAGDCYRFCLSNPNVDVALTAPGNAARLAENVAALERGPLQADEEGWMRAFGRAVHG